MPHDRQLLPAGAKRNGVLELREVQRYGSDCYGDTDYVSIDDTSGTYMEVDVLIVGTGPTGLMLANRLVRHGVRVSIIGRHAGPSLQRSTGRCRAHTLRCREIGHEDRKGSNRRSALGVGQLGQDLAADSPDVRNCDA
jgi:hypothetical protein